MLEAGLYTPRGVAEGLAGPEHLEPQAINVKQPERILDRVGSCNRDLVIPAIERAIAIDPERGDWICERW